MQVVIDISEDNFNSIYHGGLCFIGHDRLDECITEAFQTARIIPKGHGDLIDRDTLNLDYEVSMADDWKTAHEIANCVKYAPTVIEADKENKE